jgi:acyl-CoA thioesterase I
MHTRRAESSAPPHRTLFPPEVGLRFRIPSPYLPVLLGAALSSAQPASPIRWACIGNSITAGPSATDAYPAKLQSLLGPAFLVENDGVSGRTLLKKGDFSYWDKGKLANVFAFKPDIVTIKLGTNDSKPINWDTHKGEFEGDLAALIDTLGTISSKPKVYLMIPCPAFSDGSGSGGIRGTVIASEIIPLIKKVALAKNVPTIDLYTPMLAHKALFPDNVHPNAVGHDSISRIIFRTHLSKVSRIACIGNSITHYAFGTPGTEMKDAYPMRLNMLYGRDYWVENDGQSGAYMQRVSPNPYYKLSLLGRAMKLVPQIVTIKLGTNDSRPQAWNTAPFIADSKFLLDSLGKISPKPRIVICLPIPSFKRNGEFQFQNINDSIIVNHTIPALKKVAEERGLQVVDLYAVMKNHEALVPDGVHPNAAGQDTIAHVLWRALKSPPVTARGTMPWKAAYPDISVDRGTLSVTLGGGDNGYGRLYAMDGRQVLELTLRDGEASVASLAGYAPGRYFLAVERAQGGPLAVKSVTIEAGSR